MYRGVEQKTVLFVGILKKGRAAYACDSRSREFGLELCLPWEVKRLCICSGRELSLRSVECFVGGHSQQDLLPWEESSRDSGLRCVWRSPRL